jgi:hypothetical protein
MNEVILSYKRTLFRTPDLILTGDPKIPHVLKNGIDVIIYRGDKVVFRQNGQGITHYFDGNKITPKCTLVKFFPMCLGFSEVKKATIIRIGYNTFGPIKYSFDINNVEKARLEISNKVFSTEDKFTLVFGDLDEIERDIIVYLMMVVYFERHDTAGI